jgi:hypothetical protein
MERNENSNTEDANRYLNEEEEKIHEEHNIRN